MSQFQGSTAPAVDLVHAALVYLIVYVNDLEESRRFYQEQLGLLPLESDETAVKFDAGQVILCLHRASDYGVTLPGRCDDASDIVFLVDDINTVRSDLEARGVVFVRRRTYEIGWVTDFYDPNGHRLMIYQPSEKALSWPSGNKLREVWSKCGVGSDQPIGPPAVSYSATRSESSGLRGKPLVYLFLFVPDSESAREYYQHKLGLSAVESVHCCNPACPPEEKGIVKYDVGGLLLTTHHIHRSPVIDDFGTVYSPKTANPDHMKGIVPVFTVQHLEATTAELADRGIRFSHALIHSHIGDIAKVDTDTGHTIFLYRPSLGALQWPAGIKAREIIRCCNPPQTAHLTGDGK